MWEPNYREMIKIGWLLIWRGFWLGLFLLALPLLSFVLISSSMVHAADSLDLGPVNSDQPKPNITTILADPPKYMAFISGMSIYTVPMVSLEGIVRDPRLRNDVSGTGVKECSQAFYLVDDTGSITTFFPSTCEAMERDGLILSAGDRIVVEGQVISSGRDGKGNHLGLQFHARKISQP